MPHWHIMTTTSILILQMRTLFLIVIVPFFGSVNQPLRCELSSGYRNDRIHWHLQKPGDKGPTIYSEIYRDVEFWENAITFRAIHRDLTFFLKGAYGTFGRGNLTQKYKNLIFTPDQLQFNFNTDGWSADGSGYVSYAVNLTAGRTYQVILLPLIGYSAYFERLNRKEGRPEPLVSPDFTFYSSLTHQLQLDWYGFFFGAGFIIEPGGNLAFNAGYSYHLPRIRFRTAYQNQITIPPTTTTSSYSVKTKEGGNLGHTGWAQFDYLLNSLWRMGIGAQIHYFSSQVITATLKHENSPNTAEKLKLRWTSVSGWAQVSRQF